MDISRTSMLENSESGGPVLQLSPGKVANEISEQKNGEKLDAEEKTISEEERAFLSKEESTNKVEEDVRCGCGCFYPQWLQICASKKTFAVAYTIVLTLLYAMNSYFIGTISTIEKNYKMTSKMLGSIKGTAEIGGLIFNFALTYFIGKGNKATWLAVGMVVLGASAFVRTLPHFVFDSGLNIRTYTNEYRSTQQSNVLFANASKPELWHEDNCEDLYSENVADRFAFNSFLIAHFIFEMGAILLKTSGAVYLDDNTRKNIFPLLFSIIYAVRTIGTFIGFLLASYTLQIFVNPQLTPNIESSDPRWIGAWWLGWIPIGTIYITLAGFLMLFPRSLPRAAMRRRQMTVPPNNTLPASMSDFIQSIKRVLKNKIVLLDSLSSVCTKIGLAAFEIFLPKYIESQYGVSASDSSLLVGIIMLIGKSFSVLIVGMIITKFKPPPRGLMATNVLIGISCSVVQLSFILISCQQPHVAGQWDENHKWNLSQSCNIDRNCTEDIKYSPVCSVNDNLIFYSPCHAGCVTSSFINNTKTYNQCSCVVPQTAPVIAGTCSTSCSMKIFAFLFMLGLFRFIRTSAKSIKKIMRFRFVAEADKSLSLGINKSMLSLLAAFPSPIIYGMIFDWACILFDNTCGTTGNCWSYDIVKLRYVLNITACSFLILGTFLDGILWYFIKGLKMYDEDFENKEQLQSAKIDPSS